MICLDDDGRRLEAAGPRPRARSDHVRRPRPARERDGPHRVAPAQHEGVPAPAPHPPARLLRHRLSGGDAHPLRPQHRRLPHGAPAARRDRARAGSEARPRPGASGAAGRAAPRHRPWPVQPRLRERLGGDRAAAAARGLGRRDRARRHRDQPRAARRGREPAGAGRSAAEGGGAQGRLRGRRLQPVRRRPARLRPARPADDRGAVRPRRLGLADRLPGGRFRHHRRAGLPAGAVPVPRTQGDRGRGGLPGGALPPLLDGLRAQDDARGREDAGGGAGGCRDGAAGYEPGAARAGAALSHVAGAVARRLPSPRRRGDLGGALGVRRLPDRTGGGELAGRLRDRRLYKCLEIGSWDEPQGNLYLRFRRETGGAPRRMAGRPAVRPVHHHAATRGTTSTTTPRPSARCW